MCRTWSSVVSFLFGFLALNLASSSADDFEDLSRQDLFFAMRALDAGTTNFSLPPRFKFPDDAREESIFGIDLSHHVPRNCKCDINWDGISASKVQFVYLKATEGSTHLDTLYTTAVEKLRDSKDLELGVFHFLTASSSPIDQANFFLSSTENFPSDTLVPALDLEWNLGKMRDDCPQDAIVTIPRRGGGFLQKCDLWAFVSADEIINIANSWIDKVKQSTGKTPMLYTNLVWWRQRIGNEQKIKKIKTDLIWIADYSKAGLATEAPRVPAGAEWVVWQFSDSAKLPNFSSEILVDASIFYGDKAKLLERLTTRKK